MKISLNVKFKVSNDFVATTAIIFRKYKSLVYLFALLLIHIIFRHLITPFVYIHSPSITPSVFQFRLKAHLFHKSFLPQSAVSPALPFTELNLDPSQVKFIFFNSRIHKTAKLHNAKSMQSQNYTMKSTTKYTERKRRTTILMQSIDNLTENRPGLTAHRRRLLCFSFIFIFYRAMHFSAKRGIAIACRLSVCPSVRLSVCL